MHLTDTKQTLFYNLLYGSSFRWIRRMVLFILLLSVSANQIVSVFDWADSPGLDFLLATVVTALLYYMVIYLQLKLNIPRSYLKGRLVRYILCFFFLITFIIFLNIGIEYVCIYYFHYQPLRWSYFSTESPAILTFISDFIIFSITLMGISMPVFLRHNLEEIEKLQELEKKQLSVELNQLKDKVSPEYLQQVLHRMGEQATEEPVKAGGMVLHLSRLLRYQLYEGNKEEVILSGEIQYLTTYLALEQLYRKGFHYQIRVEGEAHRAFVPPLIYFPVVRKAVHCWSESGEHEPLVLEFTIREKEVVFVCNYMPEPDRNDPVITKIGRRFELQAGYSWIWTHCKGVAVSGSCFENVISWKE